VQQIAMASMHRQFAKFKQEVLSLTWQQIQTSQEQIYEDVQGLKDKVSQIGDTAGLGQVCSQTLATTKTECTKNSADIINLQEDMKTMKLRVLDMENCNIYIHKFRETLSNLERVTHEVKSRLDKQDEKLATAVKDTVRISELKDLQNEKANGHLNSSSWWPITQSEFEKSQKRHREALLGLEAKIQAVQAKVASNSEGLSAYLPSLTSWWTQKQEVLHEEGENLKQLLDEKAKKMHDTFQEAKIRLARVENRTDRLENCTDQLEKQEKLATKELRTTRNELADVQELSAVLPTSEIVAGIVGRLESLDAAIIDMRNQLKEEKRPTATQTVVAAERIREKLSDARGRAPETATLDNVKWGSLFNVSPVAAAEPFREERNDVRGRASEAASLEQALAPPAR
jgi:DNA repair exonuclease SbcCD ATPase subunit